MQTLSAPRRRAIVRADIKAHELKHALDRVKPAVASRSAAPACRAVLIHADDDSLIVCATGGDFTVRTRLRATVSGNGSILVPFARLQAVVGRLRGAVVLEVASREGDLTLTSESSSTKARLAALTAEDFPALTFNGTGQAAPLGLDVIRRVLPAASKEKARPVLQAVLLDGTDVVATDSYRLHLERVNDPLPRCLLPAWTLAAVAATAHDTVDVRVDRLAGVAQLTVPDTEYLIRTVAREWVDYTHLIPRPAETNVVATFLAKDLVDAAARLRPLTTSQSPAPPAWLALEPDRITLTVEVSDLGSGEIEIPADVQGADSTKHIAFNLAFLGTSVRACGSQRVSIHLRDSHKPAVIVGEGVDWDRAGTGLRLLMPLPLSRPADLVALPPVSPPPRTEAAGRVAHGSNHVVTPRDMRSRRITRRRAARY